MKKMRYGAMAITIAVGVGAFLLAQRLDIIPGPWSQDRASWIAEARFEAAREAIKDPQDYLSFYQRGVTLAKHRELERALADLNAAVQLRPTPISAEVLGARWMSLQDEDARTLHRVVLVHMARADVLQQMNRPAEALADMDQALAFNNRKADTLQQRGLLRLVSGRPADAVTDFDTLLNIRPNVDWYFTRGIAKYALADWAGAIENFRAAVRMEPGGQRHMIWLAKAYLRAGRTIPDDVLATIGPNSDARYVIDALMSDYNPAQFMAVARAGAAYVDRRKRGVQCETALLTGEWLIVRKKGAGARDIFNEAAASCQPLSIEHAVAAAELERLTP